MVHTSNWLMLFLAPLLLTTSAYSNDTPVPNPSILQGSRSLYSGFRVQIDSLRNFSRTDTNKIDDAARLFETVFNSDQFRRAVYGFTWMGKATFADNDGLTNEQVYARLMAGQETYSSEEDHTANLNLGLYSPPFFKKWNVVGYGYPGTPQIYINRNYLRVLPVAEIAGLLAHEWCHKLGFNHDFQRTLKRPYSVPYGIGTLVATLANESITSEPNQPFVERNIE